MRHLFRTAIQGFLVENHSMTVWRTRGFFLFVLCAAMAILGMYVVGDGGVGYLWIRLQFSVTLVFLALAAATLISAGQIDISSGAVLSFCGTMVLYASHMVGQDVPLYAILATTFLFSMLLYLLYAFAVVDWKIHPLITTLAAATALRGVSEIVYVGAQGVEGLRFLKPEGFQGALASLSDTHYDIARLLDSPSLYMVVILLAVAGMAYWRHRIPIGLHHVALGENPLASVRAGIDRRRVLLLAFCIAGVFVYLGWLNEFFAVRDAKWSVQDGRGNELMAIAAAVIGGTRIEGGRLEPLSVALAAMFITLTGGVAMQLDLPSETNYLVIGAALLLAILWDRKTEAKSDDGSYASVTSTVA